MKACRAETLKSRPGVKIFLFGRSYLGINHPRDAQYRSTSCAWPDMRFL